MSASALILLVVGLLGYATGHILKRANYKEDESRSTHASMLLRFVSRGQRSPRLTVLRVRDRLAVRLQVIVWLRRARCTFRHGERSSGLFGLARGGAAFRAARHDLGLDVIHLLLERFALLIETLQVRLHVGHSRQLKAGHHGLRLHLRVLAAFPVERVHLTLDRSAARGELATLRRGHTAAAALGSFVVVLLIE